MIGSMLRTPHHHHHSSSQHLHHGQQQQLDGGNSPNPSLKPNPNPNPNSSFAAASSAYPRGTYLLASNAMKAHTQLKVVRATAPPPRAVSRSSLAVNYDRYELLAQIRTPPSDVTGPPGTATATAWPLGLRLKGLRLYPHKLNVNAATTHDAAANTAAANTAPPVYAGMQAAAPP
eukprot:scaffold37562_cov33-Phaeocystis_antarctica.AAC.1